jgi:hypothetical protein
MDGEKIGGEVKRKRGPRGSRQAGRHQVDVQALGAGVQGGSDLIGPRFGRRPPSVAVSVVTGLGLSPVVSCPLGGPHTVLGRVVAGLWRCFTDYSSVAVWVARARC